MAEIVMEGLWQTHPGGIRVLGAANREIHDGEFRVLVGPSGCGKSKILRAIAASEEI